MNEPIAIKNPGRDGIGTMQMDLWLPRRMMR